jgi:hypothetical protein
MAWWKNMVDGKKMQSMVLQYHSQSTNVPIIDPYGSSESTRVDGTAMSSFVSWDSKITTVNAVLGGVTDFVREKMQQDGIYNEFISVIQVRIKALHRNSFKL